MATFPIVTIKDYVDAYDESTIQSGLFFNGQKMATLDAVVFSAPNQKKIVDMMKLFYEDQKLNTFHYSDDIVTVNDWIYKRTMAIANASVAKWHNRATALAKISGLTENEILEDYHKTITRAGSETDQNAGTVVNDGTRSRNSFNSSELVDTDGSTNTMTDTTSRTHSYTNRVDTEAGNLRPKAEAIRLFYETAEMMSLIEDIVHAFINAIAIMVY